MARIMGNMPYALQVADIFRHMCSFLISTQSTPIERKTILGIRLDFQFVSKWWYHLFSTSCIPYWVPQVYYSLTTPSSILKIPLFLISWISKLRVKYDITKWNRLEYAKLKSMPRLKHLVTFGITPDILENLSLASLSIDPLDIYHFSLINGAFVLPSCLSCLSIRFRNPATFPDGMKCLDFKQCTNLIKLTLQNCDLVAFELKLPTSLEHLSLLHSSNLSLVLPIGLEELHCSWGCLKQYSHHSFLCLKKLTIVFDVDHPGIDNGGILANITALTYLKLVNVEYLDGLPKRMPTLETLFCDFLEQDQCDRVVVLHCHFPALSCLMFSSNYDVIHWDILEPLTQLTHLLLWDTFSASFDVAHLFPNLETVELTVFQQYPGETEEIEERTIWHIKTQPPNTKMEWIREQKIDDQK